MSEGVLARGRRCCQPSFAFRVCVPSPPKKMSHSLWILLQACVVLTGAINQNEELCRGIAERETCHHNVSAMCDEVTHRDMSCDHELHKSSLPSGSCTLRYIKTTDCSVAEDGRLYPIRDFPFRLAMYRYSTWMTNRTAFNLTFPSPDWLYVDFQYRHQKAYIAKNKNKTICRRFEMKSKGIALSETLFWDCLFFENMNDQNDVYDLLLKDSSGYGGKYSFRIPNVTRIDRNDLTVSKWEVFQFLHWSYIHQTHWIPVTFQFAPFGNLTYNVTLVKCREDVKDSCTWNVPLEYRLIRGPSKIDTVEGQDRHETVVFDRRYQAAKYAVVIQIIGEDDCPTPCYVSVSPIFEFKRSPWLIRVSICITGLVAVFLVVYGFMYVYRTKHNEMIHMKQQQKVSVLLVYSTSLSIYFELIKEFANYLQERCCVQPLYVDKDITGQNPSSWTAEKIHTSDKVLFFVFDAKRGDGVTPIKDQWSYALTYFSGPYIRKHFNSSKFAVITFPFYSHVPDQIGHLRRFRLMDDFFTLVTWIHGGTILDNYMLWRPLLSIPGPVKNGRQRLKAIIEATEREIQAMPSSPISDSTPLIVATTQKGCLCQNGKCCHSTSVPSCNPADKGEPINSSSEIEYEPSIESAFDASIPRPEALPIFGEEPRVQCMTKNTNMDSSLVNAFFGL